jgi:hypothetical protein
MAAVMRRWLIVGTLVWAVALAGAAAWSYHRDAPTVREQRTIAEASPVVDRAAGALVAAAWRDDVTVEILSRRLVNGCRITPALDGATLARSITVRTVAANAPAVLDRIAGGLPAGYGAAVRHNDVGGVHRLRADAGEFVAVNGAITAPGVISLTVQTGCRPPSPGYAPEAGEDPPAERSAEMMLGGLDAEEIEIESSAVVPCPDGRPAITQRGSGRAEFAAARDLLLRVPAARVVADAPSRVAVRAARVSIEVTVDDDDPRRLEVVATLGCLRPQ